MVQKKGQSSIRVIKLSLEMTQTPAPALVNYVNLGAEIFCNTTHYLSHAHASSLPAFLFPFSPTFLRIPASTLLSLLTNLLFFFSLFLPLLPFLLISHHTCLFILSITYYSDTRTVGREFFEGSFCREQRSEI